MSFSRRRAFFRFLFLFVLGFLLFSPLFAFAQGGFPIPGAGDLDLVSPDTPLSACEVEDNFVVTAVALFGSKFPFDIIGGFPSIDDECPTLFFLGNSFEFCWVSDLFAIFKYPIWAGFMLSLFLSS